MNDKHLQPMRTPVMGADEPGIPLKQPREHVFTLWTKAGEMRTPRDFMVYVNQIRRQMESYCNLYQATNGDPIVQASSLKLLRLVVNHQSRISERYQEHMYRLHKFYCLGTNSVCVN